MHFTTQTQPHHVMVFGINTTALNKEFIIRFTPKDVEGNLARKSELLSAKQLCQRIIRNKTEEQMLKRKLQWVWDNREDITTVKLRTRGVIEFNNR